MSFAYVGQTTLGSTGGATSVATGSKAWTAGNLGVVFVGGAGSTTNYAARVTDAGGNTWFRAMGNYSSGAGTQLEVWFSVLEVGFTGTVTAYFLSSMAASIQGFEYSFSGQCRMIDQAFKDIATSTTQTTNSVTPTSGANILLFHLLEEAVNHNYTEAAGWNQRIADGGAYCVFDRSVDGASGSYSHTVTVNSGADNGYFTDLVCFEEISDYPVIVDVNYKNGTSLSGGVALNMPPNISAGDLLLAFASNDAPGETTMAIDGWTAIFESADHSTVTCRHAAFAKIAAGSDTATLTGASQDYTAVVMRIENHGVSTISSDIKVSSYARSAGTASSTPNPPSLDAGSSKKWLWIASYGADDDDNNIAWCQQDYSGIREIESAASTSSTQMGISFLLYEGQTLDPAAFTMNANEEWVAYTVAIPPAASVEEHSGSGSTSAISSGTASGAKEGRGSFAAAVIAGVVAVGFAAMLGAGTASAVVGTTASGSKDVGGSGSASAVVGVTASGAKEGRGAGTASAVVIVEGSGTAEIPPEAHSGSGTTSVEAGGSASGKKETSGVGSTSAECAATTSGSKEVSGTGVASAEIGGTSSGAKDAYGSAVASAEIGVSASGTKGVSGAGTASCIATPSASGAKDGFGSGNTSAEVGVAAEGTADVVVEHSGTGETAAVVETLALGKKDTSGGGAGSCEAETSASGNKAGYGATAYSAIAEGAAGGSKNASGSGSAEHVVVLDASGVGTQSKSGAGTTSAVVTVSAFGGSILPGPGHNSIGPGSGHSSLGAEVGHVSKGPYGGQDSSGASAGHISVGPAVGHESKE